MRRIKAMGYMMLLLGLFGIYNGKLAIYNDSENVPSVVLPYSADIFTQEDQAALKEGIYFDNPFQLSAILEDFLS